jgi:hypothetical protein
VLAIECVATGNANGILGALPSSDEVLSAIRRQPLGDCLKPGAANASAWLQDSMSGVARPQLQQCVLRSGDHTTRGDVHQ